MNISYREPIRTVAAVPIDEVNTCSIILTRLGLTLIKHPLTISSKVAQLTVTKVVIKARLWKEQRNMQLYNCP